MLSQEAYLTTKKLLQARADWGPIITACAQLSEDSANGVFWGNAALNRAQQRDRSLIPLRVLGILDRVEKDTRNNHTASIPYARSGRRQTGADRDWYQPGCKLPGDFFHLHNKKEGELAQAWSGFNCPDLGQGRPAAPHAWANGFGGLHSARGA